MRVSNGSIAGVLNWDGLDGSRGTGFGDATPAGCGRVSTPPQGCRITLPIALRPASTFKASAVCASGKVRSTWDDILPSEVHFTSFSKLVRFLSALSRVHA